MTRLSGESALSSRQSFWAAAELMGYPGAHCQHTLLIFSIMRDVRGDLVEGNSNEGAIPVQEPVIAVNFDKFEPISRMTLPLADFVRVDHVVLPGRKGRDGTFQRWPFLYAIASQEGIITPHKRQNRFEKLRIIHV